MLIFVPELENHLFLVAIIIAVTITMLRKIFILFFWYQKVFVSSLFVLLEYHMFWRYDCFDGNFCFIIAYLILIERALRCKRNCSSF